MADKQISQLTAASTVNDDDLLVLQQGGTAKKLTGKKLGDYVYAAAAEKIDEVNTAVAESQAAVEELIEEKDNIVAVIASMAQLGTDTTLTQTGMAADSKTVGDKIKLLASNITGVEDTRTASKNYPIDSLLIFNYNLYKVTSPIASGELITPNTNCTATTLAAELVAIETALSTKAEINGTYEAMTVGNAEQIVATEGVEEDTPYVFRKSGGGGIAIGNREADTLIGGTIAWNQLASSGKLSISNWEGNVNTSNNVTFTKNSDGSVSITSSNQSARTYIYDNGKIMRESICHAGDVILVTASGTLTSGTIMISGAFNINGEWAPGFNGFNFKEKEGVLSKAPANADKVVLASLDSVAANNGSAVDAKIYTNAFNLTQMFGTTIADYVYGLEQAHAGDGIAWFKNLFPNDYYAYNAGELMSVNTSAHVTTGFNQWDEQWEVGSIDSATGALVDNPSYYRSKNYISVFPNTSYYFKTSGDRVFIAWYDASKIFVAWTSTTTDAGRTSPSGARYAKFVDVDHNYYNAILNPVCVNISDASNNGTYEPYDGQIYPLDSELTIYGLPKLDTNNNLYYDGDTYEADGTVNRKYGIAGLSTMTWGFYSQNSYPNLFVAPTDYIKPVSANSVIAKLISDRYTLCKANQIAGGAYKAGFIAIDSSGRVLINDPKYSTVESFVASLTNANIVYELKTPSVENAESYASNQVVNGDGTEEYVDAGVQAGTRDVSVPVGHNTVYQQDLRTKLQDAPNSPGEDGDYIMRRDNGHNTYFKRDLADTNGDYPNMTVGNAEQLVSTVGIEDKTPYNFRTSGGSVDIGDRETDMVVGGTIVWNQLTEVVDGKWTTGDNNIGVSVSNGIVTVTVIGTAGRWSAATFNLQQSASIVTGHKFLISAYMKGDHTGFDVAMQNFSPLAAVTKTVGEWTEITKIGVVVDGAYHGYQLQFGTEYASFAADDKIQGKNTLAIDLTQMFGATIANYIYSLEQTTAGAGVAWFKSLFPKPYYEYNAGELLSVNTSAHNMTGFNQWDEQWEVGSIDTTTGNNNNTGTRIRSKNYIPILPNTLYCTMFATASGNTTQSHIECYYDANKNFISGAWDSTLVKTTPENAYYMRFATNDDNGTTYKNDICINLSWDGERDGEYEPYVEYTYPLDSSLELRGAPRLDSGNNLYFDGDTYESDGTVTRKYTAVDMGDLTWVYLSSAQVFYANLDQRGMKQNANIVCDKYAVTREIYSNLSDKSITSNISTFSQVQHDVIVKDLAYSDVTSFTTAVTGSTLVYELETPNIREAEPYQNQQIVDDFGTEEYVDYAESQGTRDVKVPVGHETVYAPNLRAKLEMAPDSPDGDGDYIVRQTNGENQYVQLVIPQELPNTPGTDGTYRLQAVVSGGTATLSWVSAT